MIKEGIPVTIEGVEYPSIREAARALGCATKTIRRNIDRCGGTVISEFKKDHPRTPRETFFMGKKYRSITSAARANKVSASKMYRIQDGSRQWTDKK